MKSTVESAHSSDISFFKEILGLLETIGKYIASEKRPEFRNRVKFGLWDLNTALIDTLSKVTSTDTDEELGDFDEDWLQLRDKCELLKRRIQLLSPRTKVDFEATLKWMAEQGVEEDLDLIQHLKKSLSHESENVKRLFAIAEQRIIERIYDPHKELQGFFNLSQEEFARIMGVTDYDTKDSFSYHANQTVESLRLIKESSEAQIEKKEIKRWLHAPNPVFGNRIPIDVIMSGETDRVLDIFIQLEEGIHN